MSVRDSQEAKRQLDELISENKRERGALVHATIDGLHGLRNHLTHTLSGLRTSHSPADSYASNVAYFAVNASDLGDPQRPYSSFGTPRAVSARASSALFPISGWQSRGRWALYTAIFASKAALILA